MSYASKYYVAHSRPHTPSASTHLTPGGSRSPSDPPSRPSSPGPPLPHRGIVISSPRTRSALTQAHTVSGKAVKVSTKTVEVVDSLIKKAVGRKERANPTSGTRGVPPNLPPRDGGKGGPTPPSTSFDSAPPPLPPRPALRTRDKVILSAEVVLSTIDESIRRILDTGSEEITRVVGHK